MDCDKTAEEMAEDITRYWCSVANVDGIVIEGETEFQQLRESIVVQIKSYAKQEVEKQRKRDTEFCWKKVAIWEDQMPALTRSGFEQEYRLTEARIQEAKSLAYSIEKGDG